MCLKKVTEKSNWFAYLRFCTFCARKEKIQRNEKSYNGNVLNTDGPINHFRCVCEYLRELVCGDINLVFTF